MGTAKGFGIGRDPELGAPFVPRIVVFIIRISSAAMGALRSFEWPGNIRQLQSVLERATAFAGNAELPEHVIRYFPKSRGEGPTGPVPGGNRSLTLY